MGSILICGITKIVRQVIPFPLMDLRPAMSKVGQLSMGLQRQAELLDSYPTNLTMMATTPRVVGPAVLTMNGQMVGKTMMHGIHM